VTRLDRAVLRFMRTHGHAPAIERAALGYTRLGERSFLWVAIALAGYALDEKGRPVYVRALRAQAAAQAANFAVKVLIRRRRPELEGLPPLVKTPTQLSYPSAHATSSLAAARVLSEALPAPLIYVAAIAMALTRPYLGVHYPSDTLAGALLGTAIADLVPAPR
jgi:membrane-associated phospholipid phosphatase